MTETPEEMYQKLMKVYDTKQKTSFVAPSLACAVKLLNHYRSQVQVLREDLDGVAFELDLYAAAFTRNPKWGNDFKDLAKKIRVTLEATTDKWSE